MELAVLTLFAVLLIGALAAGVPILYALIAGLILFSAYSLKCGFTLEQTGKMCLKGVNTVKNVLITMTIIGVLTGLWRSSGTIPAIVGYCVQLITPSVFLLLTFLLNSLVSFLIGTSFGTAATMGAICIVMAQAMDISLALAGGAAISGAFFGDRCSPVSTSTLLVAEVTHTDMYKNIPKLMKDSIVPFVISCVAYLVMGWLQSASGSAAAGAGELFSREFRMGLIPLIPAASIFILAICKVEVKKAMAVSIFLAFVICLVYQHRPLTETLYSMVFGYVSEDAQISKMLNGGGIQSMIKVVAVVCLSSCYSGIFEKTGLLLPLQEKIIKAGEKLAPFAVVLPVSVIACAVSCNQSLATLVTEQLCNKLVTDQEKMAMYLEDGTIVIAPLIPWSIAGAVPLASMGAPGTALFAGCYLYALPLWRLITDCFTRGKQKV